MKMTIDLNSKFNGRMNSSVDNVEWRLYTNHPLLSKEWDYAVIAEVENDQKNGRISVVDNNGKEIADMTSHLLNDRSMVTTFRAYQSDYPELEDRIENVYLKVNQSMIKEAFIAAKKENYRNEKTEEN